MNPSPLSFKESVLVGSDHMTILAESILEGIDGPVRHKHVRFPAMYMEENWPVTVPYF
jgi:hypothetical protein